MTAPNPGTPSLWGSLSGGTRPRGRFLSWLLAAAAAGFGLVSLRYLALYVRPELLPGNVDEYTKFPDAILFGLHFGGMATGLLCCVPLLTGREPFAPRPWWTRSVLALFVPGGLFGLYYPFVRGAFDVSSWIMLTIQVGLYAFTYQAHRTLALGDTWRHRRAMAVVFSLGFGAAIWRMVFGFLVGERAWRDVASARHESMAEAFPQAYHSSWYLSLVIAIALATLLWRAIGPRTGSAAVSLEDLLAQNRRGD